MNAHAAFPTHEKLTEMLVMGLDIKTTKLSRTRSSAAIKWMHPRHTSREAHAEFSQQHSVFTQDVLQTKLAGVILKGLDLKADMLSATSRKAAMKMVLGKLGACPGLTTGHLRLS